MFEHTLIDKIKKHTGHDLSVSGPVGTVGIDSM